MKRSGPIIRRTPLSKARIKAKILDPAKSLAYADAREALLARAGNACEVCGVKLNLTRLHAHHRRSRSSGRRDDGLANLLALCPACHNIGTYSVHANPINGAAHGRLISRHDQRAPSQIPVSLRGGWALLGDDGAVVPLPQWTPGP